MIRNFILSVFVLLGTIGMASAQLTDATIKAEVKDFGLLIMKSYCDRDCNVLYNALDNNLKTFAKGEPFVKDASVQTAFCDANANPMRTDLTVTLKAYKLNHTTQVLNKTEFEQAYPNNAQALQLQTGDYYFEGYRLASSSSVNQLRFNEMTRFIVRKVGGAWKIIAI